LDASDQGAPFFSLESLLRPVNGGRNLAVWQSAAANRRGGQCVNRRPERLRKPLLKFGKTPRLPASA
jgi:hypothetical protein